MAIANKLTTLNGIKTDIKTAINGKGGSVGDDFTTYATAISNLPSGGGDDLKNLIERDITSIDIPSGTTTIGYYAFFGCSGLTSVTIPNSVTTIGSHSFSGCSGLTSVTIPNSVTTIDAAAFGGCTSLTSVTIPDSVTSIGNSAFSDCTGLTSVTIPDSVTSIGDRTFSGCSRLTSITIPDSVTSIGYYAFYGCSGLTSITSLNTTPPTIANANAFINVPANCAIYVPSASVDTYKAANIWSTRAAYIQAIDSGGGGGETSSYVTKLVKVSDPSVYVTLDEEGNHDGSLSTNTGYRIVVTDNGQELTCGDFGITLIDQYDSSVTVNDCQFKTSRYALDNVYTLTITVGGATLNYSDIS